MKYSKLLSSVTLCLTLCAAPGCVSSEGTVGGGPNDEYGVGGDRSPTVRTLHSMSRVLAAQGRDGQCELVLSRLIAEHPDFMPAYVELAELMMRNDRAYDASQVLAAGAIQDPNDPVVQNDLGMTLMLTGDYQGALDAFERAHELEPIDMRTRSNQATALALLGRYDEALDVYLDVVPPVDAHHNLAVLAESNGDGVRAAREFAISQALEDGTYDELYGEEAQKKKRRKNGLE